MTMSFAQDDNELRPCTTMPRSPHNCAGLQECLVTDSIPPMPLRSFFTAFVLIAIAGSPARAQTASGDSTVALLVDLIRTNTSNPPGNERLIAELLAPRFKALGFDVKIIQA